MTTYGLEEFTNLGDYEIMNIRRKKTPLKKRGTSYQGTEVLPIKGQKYFLSRNRGTSNQETEVLPIKGQKYFLSRNKGTYLND